MGRFDRIHNKIKYIAFGKVRIGRNAQKQHNVRAEPEGSIEEKARNTFEEEVKTASFEIEDIKKLRSSKVGRIWEKIIF